jgi:hypothetical protein
VNNMLYRNVYVREIDGKEIKMNCGRKQKTILLLCSKMYENDVHHFFKEVIFSLLLRHNVEGCIR